MSKVYQKNASRVLSKCTYREKSRHELDKNTIKTTRKTKRKAKKKKKNKERNKENQI